MILRKEKGSRLTTDEIDDNFSELSKRMTLKGNQTISGKKQFLKNPIVPSIPSSDNSLANYEYLKSKLIPDNVHYSEEFPVLDVKSTDKNIWFNLKEQTVFKWNGQTWNPNGNVKDFKITSDKIWFIRYNNTLANFDISTQTYTEYPELVNVVKFEVSAYVLAKTGDGSVWFSSGGSFTKLPSVFDNANNFSISSQKILIEKLDGSVYYLDFRDNTKSSPFIESNYVLIPGINNVKELICSFVFCYIITNTGIVYEDAYNNFYVNQFIYNPKKIVPFGATVVWQMQNGSVWLLGFDHWGFSGVIESSHLTPLPLQDLNNSLKIMGRYDLNEPASLYFIKENGTLWKAQYSYGPFGLNHTYISTSSFPIENLYRNNQYYPLKLSDVDKISTSNDMITLVDNSGHLIYFSYNQDYSIML